LKVVWPGSKLNVAVVAGHLTICLAVISRAFDIGGFIDRVLGQPFMNLSTPAP
jgi:hypothetical protein